jgi:D-threo-aldose 1-dehydrogenase
VVKAIGTGMNQWEMPARFMRDFHLDIVLLAGRYTLLDQSALEQFLPLCEQAGTRIAVGGPYNSGILAAADLRGPVWFNYQPAGEHWITKAQALAEVAARHDVSLKAAALQFPLAHPAVATVIPGAATIEQIRENAALIAADIPADFWSELKTLSLLPGDAPAP